MQPMTIHFHLLTTHSLYFLGSVTFTLLCSHLINGCFHTLSKPFILYRIDAFLFFSRTDKFHSFHPVNYSFSSMLFQVMTEICEINVGLIDIPKIDSGEGGSTGDDSQVKFCVFMQLSI